MPVASARHPHAIISLQTFGTVAASATTGEAGRAEHREARVRREARAMAKHRAWLEGKRTAP